MVNRLAVGTVQFGMPYGVANSSGPPALDEASRILEFAARSGIDTLDTAIAYGDSESRLGAIGVRNWRVVTKLPKVPAGIADVRGWVRESVAASLGRLQLTAITGLLLHDSGDLSGPHGPALAQAMQDLKREGVVQKIGVSVYGPDEADRVLEIFSPDLIQAPFNVFDRRLESSGCLQRLTSRGVEVHVRSAFLQGLLLMDAAARPQRFTSWQSALQRWDRYLATSGLSALHACLAFVLSEPRVARVVVGVERLHQLREIVAAAELRHERPPADLASEDPDLIIPSRWTAA